MTKSFKKICCLLLAAVLMLSPVGASVMHAETTEAAVLNGLTKISGNYYYYVNGVKTLNKWKYVNGKYYYFGADGKAYKAAAYGSSKYQIAVKKIGTKRYAFNMYGMRVGAGDYVAIQNYQGYLYRIYPNGTVNEAYTAKLKAATRYEANAATLLSLVGKPLKKTVATGCFYIGGYDTTYSFKYYTLQTAKRSKTATTEVLLDLNPAETITTAPVASTLTETQKYAKVRLTYLNNKVAPVQNKSNWTLLKNAFTWSANLAYYGMNMTSTENYYALYGFKNRKGNCAVQAATFAAMAKYMGYKAKYVQGYYKTKSGANPHAWVEITYGTDVVVYDPNFNTSSMAKAAGLKNAGWNFHYGDAKTLTYLDSNKKVKS